MSSYASTLQPWASRQLPSNKGKPHISCHFSGTLAHLNCAPASPHLHLLPFVHPCAGITGAGMAGWDLPALTSLQLQNSPAVDDAGMAAIAGLTALRR